MRRCVGMVCRYVVRDTSYKSSLGSVRGHRSGAGSPSRHRPAAGVDLRQCPSVGRAGVRLTNFGPIQGPADPPAWSPPPGSRQPSGYGQPTGYGPAAEASQLAGFGPGREATFDATSVDLLDWLAMGVAVLAFIFSFFAYFSYQATSAESRGECTRLAELPGQARGLARELCGGATAGAWHGFFGWFGVLLGLLAAGLVAYTAFVHHPNPPVRTRRLALGIAGLAVLSTLIALVDIPDWPALQSFAANVGGSYSSSQYDKNISNGHGFSYWIVLIALAALTVVTLLQLRHTGATTSTSAAEAAVRRGPYELPPGTSTPHSPPAGYQQTWQRPPPQQPWTAPPRPITPDKPPSGPPAGQ